MYSDMTYAQAFFIISLYGLCAGKIAALIVMIFHEWLKDRQEREDKKRIESQLHLRYLNYVLDMYVEQERYEEAAKIRDQIQFKEKAT